MGGAHHFDAAALGDPLGVDVVDGHAKKGGESPQPSTGRRWGARPSNAQANRPRPSPRARNGSARPPAGRNGRFTAATASEPERAASTISAVSTEIRSVIECVLNDSLGPAIRDLAAAASYRPQEKES